MISWAQILAEPFRRQTRHGLERARLLEQMGCAGDDPELLGAAQLRQGLPIASGVIEAACKTLVTQRMKRSGMAWRQPGGQGILTIRSLIQSDRWQAAWTLLSADFRKEVATARAQNISELAVPTALNRLNSPSAIPDRVDVTELPLAM